MNTLTAIKRKIETITNINGRKPDKIYITEAEAEEIGITEYEGTQLIVMEQPEINTDCVFYNGFNCDAMEELICRNKKCKRYNTTITQEEIDKSIRDYAIRRSK